MSIPTWLRNDLDDAGRQRIEQAVAAAESTTSGEIVPMIVRRSSTVGHVLPLTIAVLLVTVLGVGTYAIENLGLTYPLVWLGAGAVIAVGLGWALSTLALVQRVLTHPADLAHQVHTRALLAFHEANITGTTGQTGVLLFVSLMERRAVVLADRAIAERVSPETWQQVVDLVLAGIRRGTMAQGFVDAITRCGEILTPHFPIAPDDVDELPNPLRIAE